MILIIGNGRLAKHFSHYFHLLEQPHHSWHRSQPVKALNQLLETPLLIFCLIRDDALASFIQTHLTDSKHTVIHCSGCQSIPNTIGAHPLMTFSSDLFTIEQYQRVAFMVDCPVEQWHSLTPFLPNPHHYLAPELRAYYHTLCVMAGNFSQYLWQKLFTEFERLGIPEAIALPYLEAITHNIATHQPLTGPLTRHDQNTLNKHLAALSNDPFKTIYTAFIETHRAHHHE